MKNSDNNHQEFEKSWKDAFEGAEMMPSEDIWEKIDGALANQDSQKFKRKIIFYKYAAVVSLLILFGGGVLTYQFVNKNMIFRSEVSDSSEKQNELLTTKEKDDESGVKRNEPDNLGSTDAGSMKNDPESKTNTGVLNNSIASAKEEKQIKENTNRWNKSDQGLAGKYTSEGGNNTNKQNKVISPHGAGQDQKDQFNPIPDSRIAEINNNEHIDSDYLNNKFPQPLTETSLSRNSENLAFAPNKGFENLKVSTETAKKDIYRVPDYRLALSKKKTENNEFYAGLSVTPNYFDPNIQMNSGNLEAATFNQNQLAMGVNPGKEQNVQPQMSYAYAVNFGLKLSKKWIVHSGLQYAKNNTVSSTQSFLQPDFNSNVRYAATPVTLNKLSNDGLSPDKLGFTQPVSQMIELNNNFEFASIPIKAGYIIFDKKLTWIVSTGVGTDIFLNNQIEDQQNQFEKVTIKPGESSPYRNVYFNGLASSELVYNFTRNYSFSLEPSFRFALNSFSKSDSYITSLPQSFGVAAGFRYHFRK